MTIPPAFRKVVDINDHRNGWVSIPVTCCLCTNEWAAVVPADLFSSGPRWLECPNCHQMSGQVFWEWVDEDGYPLYGGGLH